MSEAEAAGAEAAGAEDEDAPALQHAPAPATSLEGVYFVVHRSADARAVNGLCKEVASSLSCVHMSFEDAMIAESALPGSELSDYQAGQSSLLGTKALPQQLGARVLLRALGRVLTTAEPGRSQHSGARVIVSGFPRNKHAAVALLEAMRSAGESADAADGAADGAAGRRVRALCVRGYGSESEPAGDTALEQLVKYLSEHGTLVEVDGRGDEVVVQSRMHAALVEVDPASNPAAFLMRARPGAGYWPGATAQLLLAAPGAEAEAEAATLCAQLCAEEPSIHYIALPLALTWRGEEGEAASGDEAAGGAAPLVAMRLLRSMALAAEAVPKRRLRFLLHGALPAEAEAEAAVEALQLVAASVALRGLLVLGGEGRLPTCRAFPPVGFFRPQASGTSRRRQKPKAHPAVRGRKPCPPTAAAGMHGRGKATVHAQRDVRVHGPVHVTSGTAQQTRALSGSAARRSLQPLAAAVAPARCLLAPDLI